MNVPALRKILSTALGLLLCGCGFAKDSGFEVTPVPLEVREYLELDDSHQKRVSVGGFSVLGSKRVSDFALKEAAFLIRRMVGNRDDLLESLNKNKTRFVIMARDEYTTDVPEHSNLKPAIYWDQRARGLGATHERPAVSCGEENLLCLPGDPYDTENILIHELAHALHQMAIVFVHPDFQDRLDKCFELATKEKIWEGTYASTNVYEYWAEGVQSWFDTNRENDHDHGSIDTREELKKSDPRLARLIGEILGETDWRYQRPQDRKKRSLHLKGFDLKKEKPFVWPKRFARWKKDFDKGLVSLAPDGSPVIKTVTQDDKTVIKSAYSRKRSRLYFHNLTQKSIVLEWIDFEGKPKQSRTLRHRDHSEISSFVGHVWQIKDYATGTISSRFVLPESKDSQLTLKNPKP
jgi:hypothetical protein